jgi:hypothetical protein
MCAPALVQRGYHESDLADESPAADVLLRQEPEEDEEEGNDKEEDDEADGDDDGYSE